MKTNFLKLVCTYEVDLEFGPEWSFPLRIELFRDTERRGWFRAHAWELEPFNVEPTFPLKPKVGKSRRYKSTELLMVERITQFAGNYDSFRAKSETDALEKVVADLKERLGHWTKEQAA